MPERSAGLAAVVAEACETGRGGGGGGAHKGRHPLTKTLAGNVLDGRGDAAVRREAVRDCARGGEDQGV